MPSCLAVDTTSTPRHDAMRYSSRCDPHFGVVLPPTSPLDDGMVLPPPWYLSPYTCQVTRSPNHGVVSYLTLLQPQPDLASGFRVSHYCSQTLWLHSCRDHGPCSLAPPTMSSPLPLPFSLTLSSLLIPLGLHTRALCESLVFVVRSYQR